MNLCECGCGEPVKPGNRFSRSGHYARVSREPIEQKYRTDPETGHWHWLRAIVHGYGYVQHPVTKKTMPAHRYVYELHRGPIPAGLTLDHLCRVRDCVNPDHLEPVSSGENVLRGEGVSANNKRKTHCLRGHPLSGDNLRITTNGGRFCRACEPVRRPRYQEANRLGAERRRRERIGWKIGDVAQFYGVSTDLVRKWVARGLVPLREQHETGHRYFDPETIRRTPAPSHRRSPRPSGE